MKALGRGAIVDEEFVHGHEINLTVMKTSLFFAGDGFTAYDSNGELAFRVDSYSPDMRDMDELILMDQQGRCLLTVRRKRPSLHQRWEGFSGEKTDGQKRIFSIKRSSMIGRASASMTVEMYGGGGVEYWIEGSFAQRICTIYDSAKEAVAEIRRKVDVSTSVVLDKAVWSLCVKPGFDVAFVMGLVLVLAQINGDDPGDDDDDGAGED